MLEHRELFADLPPAHAAQADALCPPLTRPDGAVLLREGETKDGLFVVTSGQVVIDAGGFEVTTLGPGSVLGEIGLFAHAVRTATARATGPVALREVSRAAYVALRDAGNPLAFRIERRALSQLSQRLRQVVSEIVAHAPMTPALLSANRAGDEHRGHPLLLDADRIDAAVRAAAGDEGAPRAVLDAIARLVVARTYGARETLAAAGGRRGPLILIASGEVECFAAVGERVVRVATLVAGDLLNGEQHLVGQERAVSYVARQGAGVLELAEADAVRLLGEQGPVGSWLRGALIRSLSDRLTQANGIYSLTRLTATPAPAPPRSTPAPAPPRSTPAPAPTPAPALPRATPAPAPTRATPAPAAQRPSPRRPPLTGDDVLAAPMPAPLSGPSTPSTVPNDLGFDAPRSDQDTGFDTDR